MPTLSFTILNHRSCLITTTTFLLVLIGSFTAIAPAQPPTYDLRDYGRVTAVRSQTSGTCWTHGTMAAVESNLLTTGNWAAAGEVGEPNLAEYHLDWWNGFNRYNNDDTNPTTGGGLTEHLGGDYRVASAYMARGDGMVYSAAANDAGEGDTPWFSSAPARDDPSYHYYYARHVEWYTAESDLSNIDTIKNAIITDGALGTCLCSSGAFMSGTTHYQPASSTLDPNHSVAIIGWDDGKVVSGAPGNGAWLCKNSWASSWGESGYFWISYHDKHAGQHPEMGAVAFRDVVLNPYQSVYYHDTHGWRATMSGVESIFNAFTADEDEALDAVSFYTTEDDVDYTVKVYDRYEGGQLLDELISQSGTIDYIGLHTVDLDTLVGLTNGDDFYLYLETSNSGQAVDVTSDIPVLLIDDPAPVPDFAVSAATYGESYYFDGTDWLDLQDFDFGDPMLNTSGNFCIKGLTVAVSIPEPQSLVLLVIATALLAWRRRR